MYYFSTRTRRAEKQFYKVLEKEGVKPKLEKLKQDPYKELKAHRLKGKLNGLWSCYIGNNLRLIYEIDEENKEIVVVAAGSHNKVYY